MSEWFNLPVMEGMRLVMAFLSGVLLSLAGSLIQGVTQNELAGPSTLGLDAFVVFIVLFSHGLLMLTNWALPLEWLSFILFLVVTAIFHGLTVLKGKRTLRFFTNRFSSKVSFFILFGLCFNLFAGACFSILQFLFITYNKQFPAQLWYGNFRFVDEKMVLLFGVVGPCLYIWAFHLAKKLRPLTFGSDYSLGLGVPVTQIQMQSLFLALYAEGIVGCFFGIFSFLGLIFPHLLRSHPFFARNIYREIVVGSLFAGFVFMGLDYLCLNILFFAAEIPVGMVTSFLGTFLLLGILWRHKRSNQSQSLF